MNQCPTQTVDATRNCRSDQGSSVTTASAVLQLSRWPRCRNTGRCCLALLGLHCGEKEHLLDVYKPHKAPNVSNGSWVVTHISSWHALVELVRNITNRSIPIPQPPVGGNPCSSLLVGTITKHERLRQKKRYSRVYERLVDALDFIIAGVLLPRLNGTGLFGKTVI